MLKLQTFKNKFTIMSSDLQEMELREQNYMDQWHINHLKCKKCEQKCDRHDILKCIMWILEQSVFKCNTISCWSILWNVLIHRDLQSILIIWELWSTNSPFIFCMDIEETVMYTFNATSHSFNMKLILIGRP